MADVYQTKNSTYVIDLDQKRYMRLPIVINPAHVGSERGDYNVWLPLKDVPEPVKLIPDPYTPFRAPETRPLILNILHETSTIGILTSPVLFVAKGVDPAEWEA